MLAVGNNVIVSVLLKNIILNVYIKPRGTGLLETENGVHKTMLSFELKILTPKRGR